MTEPRHSELYGANEGEVFIPRFQATIPIAFNWLANLSYDKASKRVSYEWDIHFNRNAHSHYADRMDVETYDITGADYDNHHLANQALFTGLEMILTEVFGLKPSEKISAVTVSPRNEFVSITVLDANDVFLGSLQKSALSGYHDLIAANPMVVFGFIQAARQYDNATKERFVNCNDVPLPSME